MTDNKVKWSYLAGIIDGEGTIAINKHNAASRGNSDLKQTYAVELTIVNTDIRLMKWIISNFGGQYYVRPSRNPKHKQSMAWRATGAANRTQILLGVLPYLIMKHEQATLALQYLELHYTKDNVAREKLYLRSRDLNAKGPSTVTTNMPSSLEIEMKIESDLIGDYERDPMVTLES